MKCKHSPLKPEHQVNRAVTKSVTEGQKPQENYSDVYSKTPPLNIQGNEDKSMSTMLLSH